MATIVMDLDGTLLNTKNEIIGGEQTLKLMKSLQKSSHHLSIITGRLDHDIIKINEKYHMEINERISQNGAVIYQGESLSASLLERAEALQINQYLKKYPVRVELNTISKRYWLSPRDPDFPKEFYDSSSLVNDYEDIIRYQPVVLFLVVGETKTLKMIQTNIKQNYDKVDAIMTSFSSLEIIPKGISKGEALHKIYKSQDVYAIGDSESDLSMKDYASSFYLVNEQYTIENALEDIMKEVA